VSVLLVLVFAALKDPKFSLALLMIAIFNGVFIVNWYLPAKSESGGGQNLKLMHANVLASNNQYQKLLDLVTEEDPDMVFLQEINNDWLAGITSLRSEYPYYYTEPRAGNFGIAVFSKLPFDSVLHVDSPPLGYPTITATVSIDDKDIALISSHPTIPLGTKLHAARNEQLESLAERVQSADTPVVLLGDFNASVWDPRYRNLEQSTGLLNTRRGFGVLPTWPTFMPFAMIPIDHVLVSEGIGVIDMRTGNGIGSDHLPLIVTLSL
jgi:endonuclease/exonuclease/phosphatase (EEP) superfamily protein YafD